MQSSSVAMHDLAKRPIALYLMFLKFMKTSFDRFVCFSNLHRRACTQAWTHKNGSKAKRALWGGHARDWDSGLYMFYKHFDISSPVKMKNE